MPESAHTSAWAAYWATGTLHSCPGSYDHSYTGAIGSFWREVFSQLRPGMKVLDVGTGNGALLQMLIQARAEVDIEMDGVDLAALQPAWWQQLPDATKARCRLHAQVDAAALPFAAERFDLIVSQYGLEYSQLDRSLPELFRVLGPSGRLALVLHHAQGRPVQLAKAEREHLAYVQSLGLFAAAEGLVEPMWRANTPSGRQSLDNDSSAIAAREQFNQCLAALSERAGRLEHSEVLLEARDAACRPLSQVGALGVAAARLALQDLQVAYTNAQLRLEDLIHCALPEDQVQALRRQIAQRLDTEAALRQMHEGPYLMGWTLVTAQRGSGRK